MKKTFALAALMLLCTTVFAAGIPDKILALHKPGETMTTAFTETKAMPKMKKETTKTGTLVFTAPSDLRLDYTDPAGDYTLLSASDFEVSRAGKVQKLSCKNPRWAAFRATLLYAFTGQVEELAKLNEATASYAEEGANYVCTIDTDKSAKHGIAQLKLLYSKKTGQLVSLTVTEGNGNYTTYNVK